MLATAFALATLFILLALVLNAVIYTENIATRESASVDTLDASRYEHTAREAVQTALEVENQAGNATYKSMHANVSHQVEMWSNLTARQHATEVHAVSATLQSTTNGTRIVQDTSRSMTNASDTTNWGLVSDTTGVGLFNMTVTHSSLVAPTNTSSASDLAADGVYTIVFDNGADIREVFVYANGANVTVRVANSSGVLSPGCHAPVADDTASIDLVNRTVGNSPCPDLEKLDSLESPYDISYRDGENANGTYTVVVNRPAIDADLAAPDSGVSPYGERVLYDATVEVRYVTPALTYENTTRVAGGEWA